ncbi:DUF6957 family protein [Shewanella polaris]|uniref:DUF6957 domain-containing protein n=1 Tax=Shewanella polaris TaxID=2588449 RepID=A0A4Y5YGY3_9GAMM|nr:hypothetical protein [Shewanella polaris]QDE31964.1 hypothetical protein FH971_13950 [Shewanella polaris]
MSLKTFVKNWSVVYVNDELTQLRVLWAIIEMDERNRFKSGDYVCSSRILYIEDNIARTHTGSLYVLTGLGSEYTASFEDLIQLIEGHSPSELNLELKY